MKIFKLDGHLPFRPYHEDSDVLWYSIDDEQDIERLYKMLPDLKINSWNFLEGQKVCIEPVDKIGDHTIYRIHPDGEMLSQIEWFCRQLGYKCIFEKIE